MHGTMKSFVCCLALLNALVYVQARKMEALAKTSIKALAKSGTKLSPDATAEDILAEVPSQLSGLEDASGSKDAVQATLPEATISDILSQSTEELDVQQEVGASQTGDVALPVMDGDTSKIPANIEKLENQVLRLASAAANSGNASTAMTQMVSNIVAIIQNFLIPPLDAQHAAMIANLDSTRSDVSTCYSNALDAASQASSDMYNLSTLAVEHRTCRQQQDILTQSALRLRSLADAYRDQMSVWCGRYNQSEKGYLLDGRSQCLVNHGAYHGTWWLSSFYQDQSAFWANLYNIVVAARLRCENATGVWQQADANATAAEAAKTTKAAECDQDQMQMDGASCSYKTYVDVIWSDSVSSWHSTAGACYASQVASFNSSYAHAVTVTDYLNVQLTGIWRIECYLNAFTQADINSYIQHCQQKEYYNGTILWDNTTGYFYPYPCGWSCTTVGTTPPPPVAPHECAGRYSNMSDIAGTPEYENAHYHPYNALVFECNATCCPNACR
eukprot:TRINITY_DN2576_c0_g1_i4.p1 TRINITY_DN2576_c0_g1~~TRINITY_DN2576_c0_g1_i4.p1  ORF type:complete len:502 (+),score=92.30 TRINITY_DN2576_c0_g1_i4:52-1557(+)